MKVTSPTTSGPHDLIEAFLIELASVYAVPETSVQRARRVSGNDRRLDKILLNLGLIDEVTYVRAWSGITNMVLMDPLEFPTDPVLPDLLSGRFLKASQTLPILADAERLCTAVSDPLDDYAAAAIALRTGLRIERVLVPPSDLREALEKLYPLDDSISSSEASSGIEASDRTRLSDLATDAPAIRQVNSMIERAVELHASDIHLSLSRSGPRVRYRVDGILKDEEPPPQSDYDAIISRIKVLAELDITERRMPQDGRIRYGAAGREIDLRIATMPHLEGEGAVLRVLDRSAVRIDLSSLGFPEEIGSELHRMFKEPHGIFLVTGPTGSGKTTTLYAALREIVRPERNVVSVEDPVEYRLDGVVQIQVSRKIGLTFPTALRALLRQDPDIIMVGEIRDSETAKIANQAALTGHFVLATLHTNSAAAALPRLIDMGLEPYLLSSTIRGVLAQRLIRVLCTTCSRPLERQDAALRDQLAGLAVELSITADLGRARRAVGCAACNWTGYKGRVAIAELIGVDEQLRGAILRREDETEIERLSARRYGSLLRSGVEKVIAGTSTLTEVLRVAGEGDVQ